MIIGFIIWSIVAIIFFSIGVSCRKAQEAVGFFTFANPPIVKDVKKYNNEVATLWFIVAGVLEITSIPMLFLEQNSPLFVPIIFAVIIEIFVMIIVYLKIEAKYKK